MKPTHNLKCVISEMELKFLGQAKVAFRQVIFQASCLNGMWFSDTAITLVVSDLSPLSCLAAR